MMLHQNASRESLGLCRVVVFGLWSLILLGTPLQLFSDLPKEWFEPPGGVSLLLPRSVYEALLSPSALLVLKWALVILGFLLAAGTRFYTSLAVTFGVLLLLFEVLTKGFGGFMNHARVGLLYGAWILAVFPQAVEGLSLRRSASVPVQPSLARYAAPMVAMALTFSLCYSLIGLRRLIGGGVDIFLGDALPAYLAVRSLDYGNVVWGFQHGLWIFKAPWIEWAFKAGYLVTTVMEALSPLCLFLPRFRAAWLLVIVPFHFMTLFMMNIFFWENLLLIALLLTPLPHVFASWIRARQPGEASA